MKSSADDRFNWQNQLFLGSAADQMMVRLLLAYSLLTCAELPF